MMEDKMIESQDSSIAVSYDDDDAEVEEGFKKI